MSSSKSVRNINIDAIKGIAIILVVIGHVIQYVYSPNNFDNNILFRYIYCFHMPLFMFVSGYLSYKKDNLINFKWLKKRLTSLVIPFVTWIFLSYFINIKWHQISLYDWIKNIIISPDNGGMWFLWVLFLNCVFLYIAIKLYLVLLPKLEKKLNDNKKKFILTISTLLVTYISIKFLSNHFSLLGLSLCSWHIVFFFTGYLIANYKYIFSFNPLKNYFSKIIISSLFIIFAYYWNRIGDPIFVGSLVNVLHKISLDYPIILKLFLLIYKYMVPFLGIAFIWIMIDFIPFKLKETFGYIGKYTLEIYLLQWYFIIGSSGFFIYSLISIILSIIGPLIISKLIERSALLELIIFGKVSSNKKINILKNS